MVQINIFVLLHFLSGLPFLFSNIMKFNDPQSKMPSHECPYSFKGGHRDGRVETYYVQMITMECHFNFHMTDVP
jgi:hypothetical protein